MPSTTSLSIEHQEKLWRQVSTVIAIIFVLLSVTLYWSFKADPENNVMKKVNIGVCSSTELENIIGLVNELDKRYAEYNVKYIQLPKSYDELKEELDEEEINVLIMCYPKASWKRLYNKDRFIPLVSRKIGKYAFVVIIHDFELYVDDYDLFDEHVRKDAMNAQPDLIEHFGTVVWAEELRTSGLNKRAWPKLDDVVKRAKVI